ncbi:MAG TPA: type I DNA topoisomerase [Candidatus Paceibacterota bacterium]|nr:type I DNA topoisomerase [Candidatus Paceibacterota bacterium]
MSMKLVIVESPSKAKTISKYLGSDFRVLASVGHVRDLPKSNKKAIDIDGGFVPHYEVVPKKEIIIEEIRHAAKKADEVLIATDPDREGEAIAWHLKELLTDKKIGGVISSSKIVRITYHEVTKEAVEEALKHPRAIDEHLREAQEARRVLDRLVGYDLSGLIWKKVRYGLSAGRVQSPALRIIMEREREIRAFNPETYWSIAGTWKTTSAAAKNAVLGLTCVEEPRERKEVDRILDIARSKPWHVVDIEETEQKRSPKAPFITSTLQQTASSRLGFSPSRTMGIAQKLYEAGHITYMRTDSTHLGQQALEQIAVTVGKEYGKEYLQFRTYSAKSKNAQEAHEGIRPSKMAVLNAGMNEEQKKLYRLIWQRTIASQMVDARVARTKIVANIKDADSTSQIPDFTANGSRIIYEGWLKADPESRGEEVELPKCEKGEKLDLINVDALEKQTQPPARYTEAGLIKELEKRGIGRPSTYASICRTIEERGYVEKEGRALKPTDTGDVVSSFLEEYFPTYISDTFTADMENQLDEIANGERTYVKTLSTFYGPFLKEVKSKEKLAKATNLGVADAKYKCPKCGSPMDIKLGRMGKFISCSRYPDCDGALMIDGTEIKKDEPIGTDPTTGLPIFVLNGRFGPYVQLGVKMPKVKKVKKPKVPKVKKKVGGKKVTEEANSLKDRSLSERSDNGASSVGLEEKTVSEVAVPIKPRMASIPKGVDLSSITVADAMKFLSVPRVLGVHPTTGKNVTASIGRFGPYVVHDTNFRSIKAPLNVYDITLDQALALLAQEKKPRGFAKKKKE